LIKLSRGEEMPVNADNLSKNECDFLRNIGFKVQFLRKKAGLSQAELAERSGLSDSTISHLESTSVYSVSLVVLFRIASALDVEPKTILDFD
jgi:DNA-binding XRE family transcriptional regulator